MPAVVFARVPWPAPNPGVDSNAYEKYLFLDRPATPGTPDDYTGATWRFSRLRFDDLAGDSEELFGVRGMRVDTAWTLSTGRPDVTTAILDSGIRWGAEDLRKKAHLNTGELPTPKGSTGYDSDANGVVNVEDYAGDPRVTDANGNGFLDAEDLILTFSDGTDDDNNGYVDDISGWNFLDDTNNPFDEVNHGHGSLMANHTAGEAANGSGFPGGCPNCMFVPLRVGESFIHHSVDYGRAVTYAVDQGVSLIQGSLGAVDVTRAAARAHRYAWDHGVPLILAQNDEASQHHNYPASLRYSIPVNAVRRAGTGQIGGLDPSFLYVVGCSGYGSQTWVSVSARFCSSGATALGASVVGLLQSHARNQVARGVLRAHPDSGSWPSGNVLSPAEVRGLLQQSADDVAIGPESAGTTGGAATERYPTTPGWDPYTGSGRINAKRLLERVRPDSIPPEVVIHDPPRWQPVTPRDPIEVTAAMSAWRSPSGASYELQLGCTNHPTGWNTLKNGSVGTPEETLNYTLDWSEVDAVCPDLGTTGALGPGRLERPRENRSYMMLRLVVTDGEGNEAVDRRTILGHDDPSLKASWPLRVEGSVSSPPLLVDLNGDSVREVVVSTSSGALHAYRADGSRLNGWPVETAPHPAADRHGVNGSLGIGADPIRMSASPTGPRVADLDGDGDREVILATLQGRVFAWHHDGRPLNGFPVSIDFNFSRPSIRDPINTLIPGVFAAPLPVDLNGDGTLEIVVAALDRHLYAWHHDGSPVVGYPVLLADRSQVDVDPTDHTVSPKTGVAVRRGAQVNSIPVACDLDGNGTREIVVGTNESYGEPMNVSLQSLPDRSGLGGLLSGDLGTSNGRLYALNPNGTSFSDSWPVRVPIAASNFILAYVGEGVPARPSCRDLDGDGRDEVAINAFFLGPTMVFEASGESHYGTEDDAVSSRTVDSAPVPLSLRPGSATRISDTPYTGFAGMPTLGRVDTMPAAVGTSIGARRLMDIQLPGRQLSAQDQVTVWNARTGEPLRDSPFPIEDWQFYYRHALTNVAGSGHEDVVAVSSGGSLHAWNPRTGAELSGFPKTTGHWMLGTPAVGDMDDDGREELVATSRDGWIWAWDLEPLAFVEYLDTAPRTFSDTVTLTNAHLGDTEGRDGPVRFQPGLPAVSVGLSATTGCDTPPSAPPTFQVASLGPGHPRARAASTGGFAVDLEVVPDTVSASCVRVTIDRTQASAGSYVPVRWDGTNAGWERLPSGSVVEGADGRVTFVPDHFSTFAVVPEGSLSGGGGGGSCLIERSGAPDALLAALRGLRDRLMRGSIGRWTTAAYYRWFTGPDT